MRTVRACETAVILAASLFSACATHRDIVRLEERMDVTEERQKAIQEQVSFLDSAVTQQADLLYSIRAELRTGLESITRNVEAVGEVLKYGQKGESGEVPTSSPGLPQAPGVEHTQAEAVPETTVVAEGALTPGRPGHTPEQSSGEAEPSSAVQKKALYDTAYLDMVRGNYDLAIKGFTQFIATESREELKDNAQYWTGECYYAMGKLDDAIRSFQKVVDLYPRGNKVPSALFKIGKCYYELDDTEEASRYFQSVIGGYPHSEEANLAKEYLSDLR